MKIKTRKQFIISGVLGLGMLLFLFLWILSERDNRAYERYLSNQMVSRMVHISSAPGYALSIIQAVLEKSKITKAQAGELENSFYDIALDTQNINEMDMYLGRLGDDDYNNIVSINNHYHDFFMFMTRDMNSDEMALSNEQMNKLQKMEDLMGKYNKVVEDNLIYTNNSQAKGQSSEFFDYYREQGIKSDYWVDLLKGYKDVTDSEYRIH